MADNRKEQERAELHRAIWNIANDLRGSVDGWDFKQYVLGMLFYRYISENLTVYLNKRMRMRVSVVSTMQICPMKKRKQPVGKWSPPRAFSFCRVNFLPMSAEMPHRTTI